jgi:hypothetical protein
VQYVQSNPEGKHWYFFMVTLEKRAQIRNLGSYLKNPKKKRNIKPRNTEKKVNKQNNCC